MLVDTNFISSCNLQLSVAVRSLWVIAVNKQLKVQVYSSCFPHLVNHSLNSASFFLEEFDEPMAYMPPKYTPEIKACVRGLTIHALLTLLSFPSKFQNDNN